MKQPATTTDMGCIHSHEASATVRPPTPPCPHSHPWNPNQTRDANDNYTLTPVPTRIDEHTSDHEPVDSKTLQGRLEALAKHQAVMEKIWEIQGKERHVAWPDRPVGESKF